MSRKADPFDRTTNQSGPTNMTPTADRVEGGWVENIIDGFIRDGWLPPESRANEIAVMYRANLKVERRQWSEQNERRARREYAEGWIERFMEAQA